MGPSFSTFSGGVVNVSSEHVEIFNSSFALSLVNLISFHVQMSAPSDCTKISDQHENTDSDILKYDIGFKPAVTLLVPTVSSVIHHLCPNVTMLPFNVTKIDDSKVHRQIKKVQNKWRQNNWKSVVKCCQSIKQSSSIPKSQHQIATVNLETASILNISNAECDRFEVIQSSEHWTTLQSYFNEKQSESVHLERDHSLRLFMNLMIITFQSAAYDTAYESISKTLFQSTHFRDIFENKLQCTSWAQIISLWRDSNDENKENNVKMLEFLKSYPSMMTLFILYVTIALKTDKITDIDTIHDIKWIIDRIQNDHHHELPPSLKALHIVDSICLMVDNQWDSALSVLDSVDVDIHPLSVYIRGWICYRIGRYKECKKYLIESTRRLHFEEITCFNLFAAMRHVSKSKQLQKAQDALYNLLHDGTAEEQSLSAYNWMQLHFGSDESPQRTLNEKEIESILEAIKLGTNRSMFWEKPLGVHTEITRHRLSHIAFRMILKLRYFGAATRAYQTLIQFLSDSLSNSPSDSSSDIPLNEKETMTVYRELCCALIGARNWNVIHQFTRKVLENRDDIQLKLLYIESLLQIQPTNHTDKVMAEIKGIQSACLSMNGGQRVQISWWCNLFGGRCYEMNGDLESALKYYNLAAMEEPECLLTAWYRVNVMSKMDGNFGKWMEAAVCWLQSMRIPLSQNTKWYQEWMESSNYIQKYVAKKIVRFREFGERHQILQNGEGLVFSFWFELPEYQLSKRKVIEMTRFCVEQWIAAINCTDDSVRLSLL